ncbi:MAG: CHRD domain-containing protein [Candidatus Nitrosopolaris sp.]
MSIALFSIENEHEKGSNVKYRVCSNIINTKSTVGGFVDSASAQQQKFAAILSGSNELPLVNSHGSGVANFQLSADRKSLGYQLNVTNMNNVMGTHIHSGKQGENGPVVAGLFNTNKSAPPTGIVNGQLSNGSITSAVLQGPLAGKQLSDLVNLIKTGGAYVNIHTTQNQNGELRGQISPSAAIMRLHSSHPPPHPRSPR